MGGVILVLTSSKDIVPQLLSESDTLLKGCGVGLDLLSLVDGPRLSMEESLLYCTELIGDCDCGLRG